MFHLLLSEPGYLSKLKIINKKISSCKPEEIPGLFSAIPLDIFGILLNDCPDELSEIKNYFPRMPSSDLQRQWNGSDGLTLLQQSLAFVKSLLQFIYKTGSDIESFRILDYGCGWGRLLRLFYKYVSADRLYGVDPTDRILLECKNLRTLGNISKIDFIPDRIPFDEQFDLIYSHSVFTHLSEKCHLKVLEVINNSLKRDGLLVLSVRPKFFFTQKKRNDMCQIYEDYGYAFVPLKDLEPVDGDITYGDTAISLDYIERTWKDWKVIDIDSNILIANQIYIYLKKSG